MIHENPVGAPATPKILLIMGSTRASRLCPTIARWVAGIAEASAGLGCELVDLTDRVMALVKQTGKAKFDETVELSIRLGVDPRHADQMVRGAVSLPHGLGKTIRVVVFCKPDKEAEARDAGVNEFMAKPLTARGVLERLALVIDHPRPFIRSDDYFGPDRRRRTDPRYDGPWRRAGDKGEVLSIQL